MPPSDLYIDDGNHMAVRMHTPSMQDLPTEVVVQIAGDLAVTADSPMEDLRNLRAACRFLRRVASDRS